MKHSFRSAAAIITAILLILPLFPGFSVRGRAAASSYNEHDVQKLRAFFEIHGPSPFSNGQAANGSGYDANDPSTWTSCTWDEAGRLASIEMEDLGYNIDGCLDLADCVGLTSVSASDCFVTGVILEGCSALKTVNLTGAKLTSIDVSGCPELELLWFKQNQVAELDVSNNPKLASLDCSGNLLTALDVSGCPLLTVLRCGGNQITALDVSRCPLLTELTCRNNLIAELDVTMLDSLVVLSTFNNRLRRLDLRVFNGGASFVLDASGNGYIGTTCLYETDHWQLYTRANAAEGESFIGWYSGETQLSSDQKYAVEFGGDEQHWTAHFTGEDPVPPDPLLGDVNGDGAVNNTDALLLLRYTMSLIGESDLDLSVGDLNGDGSYTSADVLIIIRYTMGLGPLNRK
ncbi:MAG: hypothetical protein K6G56_04315 [Clostridiales bacterium]|nr:hypothetical protein [Clostridiales bacterium]